jgi:hypothetical protein
MLAKRLSTRSVELARMILIQATLFESRGKTNGGLPTARPEACIVHVDASYFDCLG